jgi:hypothetical protein
MTSSEVIALLTTLPPDVKVYMIGEESGDTVEVAGIAYHHKSVMFISEEYDD